VTFPVVIIVRTLDINVDFVQTPPEINRLFDLDGLLEDVPITITSVAEGVTARGLPDFGRFAAHAAADEDECFAGAFRFERAQQEVCPQTEPAPGGEAATYYY
jgi:hypothetical protein